MFLPIVMDHNNNIVDYDFHLRFKYGHRNTVISKHNQLLS